MAGNAVGGSSAQGNGLHQQRARTGAAGQLLAQPCSPGELVGLDQQTLLTGQGQATLVVADGPGAGELDRDAEPDCTSG